MNDPRTFQLKLTVDRRAVKIGLAAALLSVLTLTLSSETLKLTTTYPSPVGIYNYIITTGDAGSATQNTILVRNAGNVGIGTAFPAAKLDVAGNANVQGPVNVGGFVMASGAGQSKVLMSDAAGKGTWQPITGGLFGYCTGDGSAPSIEPAYSSGGGRAAVGGGGGGGSGCACRAGYTLVETGAGTSGGFFSCAKQ